MPTRVTLLALAAVLFAAGCVQGGMYRWNHYDETLYRHYKNPQEREVFVENLKTTILGAEQEGQKVPPGIYAEYAYALYEEGRPQDAIPYFRKEKETWPESRFLMEKMIRNSEKRSAPAQPAGARTPKATKGPAGALEKKR